MTRHPANLRDTEEDSNHYSDDHVPFAQLEHSAHAHVISVDSGGSDCPPNQDRFVQVEKTGRRSESRCTGVPCMLLAYHVCMTRMARCRLGKTRSWHEP